MISRDLDGVPRLGASERRYLSRESAEVWTSYSKPARRNQSEECVTTCKLTAMLSHHSVTSPTITPRRVQGTRRELNTGLAGSTRRSPSPTPFFFVCSPPSSLIWAPSHTAGKIFRPQKRDCFFTSGCTARFTKHRRLAHIKSTDHWPDPAKVIRI